MSTEKYYLTEEVKYLTEMSKKIILKTDVKQEILDLLEKEEYAPAALEGNEEEVRAAITPEFFFLSYLVDNTPNHNSTGRQKLLLLRTERLGRGKDAR